MSSIIQQYLNGSTDQSNANSFTFDEGKGVKDQIAITGPLSEIYTHALNVAFTKKEITDQENETDKNVDKLDNQIEEKIAEAKKAPNTLKVSQESQAIDSAIKAKVITSILKATDGTPLQENVGFIDTGNVGDANPEETTAAAFIVDRNDALKPEVIEQVQDSAKAGVKTMLVVVADPYGATQGVQMRQTLIDVPVNELPSPNYADVELAMAAESLYTSHGVQIFKGITAFARSFAKK